MNRPAHRARKSRASYAVAPVTRAIRVALFASTAAFALTAPVVGFAASPCAADAALQLRCEVRQHEEATIDLTVVAGDVPASVTAAASDFAAEAAITLLTVQSVDIDLSGTGTVIGLDLFDPATIDFDNIADISAEALPDIDGSAIATGVRLNAIDTDAYNGGSISAFASADGGYARARAVDAFGYGMGATVHNLGDVHALAEADGGTARSAGLYVFGYASSSTVDNGGDVYAGAHGRYAYATGINSIGYGQDGSVANTGHVSTDATGDYAYAISVLNFATRAYGNASVTNDGAIQADAAGGFATASGTVNAAYRYGNATTVNGGTIHATASGTNGASANGIWNYAYTADGSVANTGAIVTVADATAGPALSTALYNEVVGTSTVHNGGSIEATATSTGLARASGVIGKSESYSYGVNDVYGDIDVEADSQDGYALAVGMYTIGTGLGSIDNQGRIAADAASVNGDATSYAAVVNGGYVGIGVMINGGDLSATASTGAAGTALATGGFVYADVASIFNDGTASATATTVDGQATANGLGTYGGYSAISNYGSVTAIATATGDAGLATSIGAEVFGYTGAAFYNAADAAITSSATASDVGGEAYAAGVLSIGNFMYAFSTNHGTVSAAASGYDAIANGLVNAALFVGDAETVNSGDISATANGVYTSTAVGVYNFAYAYGSSIDNSGSILADASTTYYKSSAIGAQAVSLFGYGETAIVNSGHIGATASAIDVPGFGQSLAWGAVALGGSYADTTIYNTGLVSSETYLGADYGFTIAYGAYARSTGGNIGIVNHGDISADAVVGKNRGYAYSYGLKAVAVYGQGDTVIENTGTIASRVDSYAGITGTIAIQAYGENTSIANAAGAHIVATAYTHQMGAAQATAIDAASKYDINVVNDGTITASGYSPQGWVNPENGDEHISRASAVGIYVAAGTMFTQGNATIVNNGDINATAIAKDNLTFFNGGAGTSGIRARSEYDVTILNTADVVADSFVDIGATGAYGVVANGRHDNRIVNAAGASILAYATAGSLATDDYGGRAISMGAETFSGDHGMVYNAGTIIARSLVTPDGGANPFRSIAEAFGVEMRTVGTGLLVNTGDIHASASADHGYATAFGARLPGNPRGNYSNSYTTTLDNAGNITAHADADHGDAWSVAGYAYALRADYACDYNGCTSTVVGGEANIVNDGLLQASANAGGGIATAYGAVSLGAFAANITNAGHITAVVDADDASAVGSLANSFEGKALLENAGVIGASANGSNASAIGVSAIGSNAAVAETPALAAISVDGPYAAVVVNHGDIVATATGDTATAIGIEATGRDADGVAIDNVGTIAVVANGTAATATGLVMASAGHHVLTNSGDIGAFGDGTRIAIQSGSAATASIANAGSLTGAVRTGDLDDTFDNAEGGLWHAVGESDFGAGDDHLVNSGTLFMEDATIRLGASTAGNVFAHSGTLAVSGASNVIDMGGPSPFQQNGVVTFVDGMPDDTLTVVGDLAGEGVLHLDVTGLHNGGDRLYVDGNIAPGSAQTIHVNLLDVPTGPDTVVTVANVAGTATADNFVLGDVAYRGNGFVSMDFGLQARIGAADAEFFLGVDVTGLNDMGSVAAALAPGAQRLVDAQIGTWRQRMGVIGGPAGDSGLSPWIRGFSDSGDVDTDQRGNFGEGGDFDFDQSSHGWELGLDARPGDNVSVGVLFADTSGSQHLKAGSGSTRLDGKTFGLYATWFSDVFYLDVSQRWSGFDARLQANTGEHTTEVSANSFNVEAGYTAWKLADVRIVPQAQYTRTRVSDISPLDNGVSTFVADGGSSSRARVGVAIDTTFQRGALTWTPYGSLNAVHEFDGEYAYNVDGGLFGTTETGGTSAMVELGLGMQSGRWSLTGGVNWLDGGALEGIGGGQVTLRYNW